jgi:protein SCO1/2
LENPTVGHVATCPYQNQKGGVKMILNIRNFNLLVLVTMISILPAIGANAHKEEHNHKVEKQTGIEPVRSTYQLAVINPAPDFELIDLKGESVSLKDLKGKIKIINFIYTSCPDVCPIVTGRLLKLQETLRKEGLLGEKVEIISISLDPERDTPEELKKYSESFKAESNGWLFLRGGEKETKKALSNYDIWTKKLENGTIDHVMRVYLVDGNDRIREIYNLAFLYPELVVRDIEMILVQK